MMGMLNLRFADNASRTFDENWPISRHAINIFPLEFFHFILRFHYSVFCRIVGGKGTD